MQYHASLITADGAYHCLVGSIIAIFTVIKWLQNFHKSESLRIEIKSKRFSYIGIFVICDFKQVVFDLFQDYLHFTCPLSIGGSDLYSDSLQIFFKQMSGIAATSLLTMVAMVVEMIGDLPPHQVGSSPHQGGHQQKYTDGGGNDWTIWWSYKLVKQDQFRNWGGSVKKNKKKRELILIVHTNSLPC